MSFRSLSRVRRNICALLLALLVLSWGYFAFTFQLDYQSIEKECHSDLATVAVSLELRVQHIVQVIDILLLEIARHYTHYTTDQLQKTVGDWFSRSPEIAVLAVFDVDSKETLFSLNNHYLPADFSAAAVIETVSPKAGLQMAEKLFPGSDGRQQVVFSRLFQAENRNLLSVFFLYADSFLDFDSNLNAGANSTVEIYHQQGLLLARQPGGVGLIGQSYVKQPLFREYLKRSPVGIADELETTDAVMRIVAYRQLAALPLVVAVGSPVHEVFAGWYNRVLNFLLLQIAVSLTVFAAVILLFRSLTRVEKIETGLAEREEHFRAMANSSVDAVISVDTSERILFWSAGAELTFGCAASEALNVPITCFLQFADEDTPLTLKQLVEVNSPWSKSRTFDVQGQRKDGELFPTELSISKGTASGHPLYTLIVRDVTERKQMEDRIRRLASHDSLTGLPNRTLLMDRLQVAMAQVQRQGGQFALLFVDLDNFKPVNDNYGHDIGDLLLQQVAVRMLDTVRASDTVARIGGDEFSLLLNNIEEAAAIEPACENLLASLNREFYISGIRIQISCSIGVALFDGHDKTASDLLKRADNAMYAAKRAGQNRYKYAAAEKSRSV